MKKTSVCYMGKDYSGEQAFEGNEKLNVKICHSSNWSFRYSNNLVSARILKAYPNSYIES